MTYLHLACPVVPLSLFPYLLFLSLFSFSLSHSHLCPYWYTTVLFRSVNVHQKVRKFVTKQPKLGSLYCTGLWWTVMGCTRLYWAKFVHERFSSMLYMGWDRWYGWIKWLSQTIGLLRAPSVLKIELYNVKLILTHFSASRLDKRVLFG